MAFLHDRNDANFVIYRQENLFTESFSLLMEMRSKGILCDVTLKVNINIAFILIAKTELFLDRRSIIFRPQKCACINHSILLRNVHFRYD